MRRALALIVALVALAAAPVAQACPKTSLAAVEREVMCPVCGVPLGLATEAPQAERQRQLISRLVDRCRTKEQIKSVLVAEFGEGVLAIPDDEGFDLVAYLVPALGILLAGGAVGLTALRWRGRRGNPAAAAAPAPKSDRLESDLDRYEL